MKYRNLETKVEQRLYFLTVSSVANGVQTFHMGRKTLPVQNKREVTV